MAKYNPVTPELLEELKKVVGAANVKTDAETLDRFKTDEETDPRLMHLPEVVVWVNSTEEVAAVMKLANRFVVPVTPRSAGTSVSDGAIPVLGGIVLNMEKMNKIIEINEDAMYAVAEAGARTIDIQMAAKAKGLLYAGDPCSAESCLIGGNIATNAGGNKAVRYGTTRNQVYSVEVVTPTGEITTLGSRLKKCSTGYCLEQLVMGSEGTLGIICKATLKLLPLPPYKVDVAAVYDDLDKAVTLVPSLIVMRACATLSSAWKPSTKTKWTPKWKNWRRSAKNPEPSMCWKQTSVFGLCVKTAWSLPALSARLPSPTIWLFLLTRLPIASSA